ncbi:MAG TPA: hypothetical protein VMM60_07605 [Ilumatobacter sp.]|nr:hypothetical protein [Ilumatobacter sp.]
MAASKPSGSKPAARSRWKRFVVAEDSMLPTLRPGDGIIGWRSRRVAVGQVRIFEHPQRPGFWLVKRVGRVDGHRFEAVSDNAAAPGVIDSRVLGPIDVVGSYRMVVRVPNRPD